MIVRNVFLTFYIYCKQCILYTSSHMINKHKILFSKQNSLSRQQSRASVFTIYCRKMYACNVNSNIGHFFTQ